MVASSAADGHFCCGFLHPVFFLCSFFFLFVAAAPKEALRIVMGLRQLAPLAHVAS